MQSTEKIFTSKYIATLCFCVVVTLLISNFVVGFAVVCGESMFPTLNSGNIVVVEKISNKYDRFDIVIVDTDDLQIIKRIIGTPGDTLQIIGGSVYINDEKLDDVIDTDIEFAGIAFEPITLGENEYFVMGDNRNNSKDSRYEDTGIINSKQIKGQVVFSFLPPKSIK